MVEVDEKAVRPMPRTSSLGVRLQSLQNNNISIGETSITGDEMKQRPPIYDAYRDSQDLKRWNRTMFSNSPTNLNKQDQDSSANDHNALTVSREKKLQPTPNLCTLEMMDKNGTEKSVMRVWESAFVGSPIKSITMTNRMKLEEGFQ